MRVALGSCPPMTVVWALAVSLPWRAGDGLSQRREEATDNPFLSLPSPRACRAMKEQRGSRQLQAQRHFLQCLQGQACAAGSCLLRCSCPGLLVPSGAAQPRARRCRCAMRDVETLASSARCSSVSAKNGIVCCSKCVCFRAFTACHSSVTRTSIRRFIASEDCATRVAPGGRLYLSIPAAHSLPSDCSRSFLPLALQRRRRDRLHQNPRQNQ